MILFEKIMKQSCHIHVVHLRAVSGMLLWHQRLGHTCGQYLYNYHNCIDVVPKFGDTNSKVLYQLPTCIQAKMYKTPLYMGPLMLPHNHSNFSLLTLPYLG